MSQGATEWFVVNARDAQWRGANGRTPICTFERDEPFPELGINVTVLEPGLLAALYHAEGAQEDFLVVSGTCLLLIEDERRLLRAWDFVHCPAGTAHAVVATDERCIVVQAGARPARSLVYPASDAARQLGVAVERETSSIDEAYGNRRRVPVPYEGWLD